MAKTVYDNIRDLIQLDIDAVEAYEQAIEKIDDPVISDQLSIFQSDHERHIDELSDYLAEQGEDVPDRSPDIKGYLLEGFTSLSSSTGTDGALKAMQSNEKLTNKKYKEATEWDLDSEAKDIIMQGYDDERTHLAYIEQELHVSH